MSRGLGDVYKRQAEEGINDLIESAGNAWNDFKDAAAEKAKEGWNSFIDLNISGMKKYNEIIQKFTGIQTRNISLSGRGAMGVSVSGSFGLTYDPSGNLALQLNVNGGGGLPGLGLGGSLILTEAASYKDLEGWGSVIGASFAPGFSLGYDQLFISNAMGSIISLGPGINLPFTAFMEAHGETGYTWTLYKVNLFEMFENMKFKNTSTCS